MSLFSVSVQINVSFENDLWSCVPLLTDQYTIPAECDEE